MECRCTTMVRMTKQPALCFVTTTTTPSLLSQSTKQCSFTPLRSYKAGVTCRTPCKSTAHASILAMSKCSGAAQDWDECAWDESSHHEDPSAKPTTKDLHSSRHVNVPHMQAHTDAIKIDYDLSREEEIDWVCEKHREDDLVHDESYYGDVAIHGKKKYDVKNSKHASVPITQAVSDDMAFDESRMDEVDYKHINDINENMHDESYYGDVAIHGKKKFQLKNAKHRVAPINMMSTMDFDPSRMDHFDWSTMQKPAGNIYDKDESYFGSVANSKVKPGLSKRAGVKAPVNIMTASVEFDSSRMDQVDWASMQMASMMDKDESYFGAVANAKARKGTAKHTRLAQPVNMTNAMDFDPSRMDDFEWSSIKEAADWALVDKDESYFGAVSAPRSKPGLSKHTRLAQPVDISAELDFDPSRTDEFDWNAFKVDWSNVDVDPSHSTSAPNQFRPRVDIHALHPANTDKALTALGVLMLSKNRSFMEFCSPSTKKCVLIATFEDFDGEYQSLVFGREPESMTLPQYFVKDYECVLVSGTYYALLQQLAREQQHDKVFSEEMKPSEIVTSIWDPTI